MKVSGAWTGHIIHLARGRQSGNGGDFGGGRLPWMEESACRGQYALFDGVLSSEVRAALHLCRAHCPVLAQCRADVKILDPRGLVSGGVLYNISGNPASRERQLAASSCVEFCEPEKAKRIKHLQRQYRSAGTAVKGGA